MTQQEQIRTTFRAIQDGLCSSDTDALEALYSPDYRGFNIYGGVERRDEIIQSFGPGGVKIDRFDVHELDVQVFTGIGLAMGTGNIAGSWQGSSFEHHVRFLDIYRLEGSEWKYYLSQITEIAAS